MGQNFVPHIRMQIVKLGRKLIAELDNPSHNYKDAVWCIVPSSAYMGQNLYLGGAPPAGRGRARNKGIAVGCPVKRIIPKNYTYKKGYQARAVEYLVPRSKAGDCRSTIPIPEDDACPNQPRRR